MMKKIIKASIMAIIAVALCMTLVFAVNAATQDEAPISELDIAYYNLSFENEAHLMYAVKSADSDIKLLVWNEPQDAYTCDTAIAAVSPLSEKRTIENEEYTVFKYRGLSAKQMTDYIYVGAYIPAKDGSEAIYGDICKYSILEYAYYLLGKTGTATTNEKLANMLENMLAYGASAQEYFNYKADTLATDNFSQVSLTNGTLPDGFNSGLYKVGSKVTITALETDENGNSFSKWTDAQGETVGTSITAEITVGASNTTYTAVYESPSYSEGLEFTLNADGQSYSVTGIGTETESTEIKIPPTHEGLPVTSIGNYALRDCTSLTSVTIGDGVTTIGLGAFLNCTSLTSVTVDENNPSYKSIDGNLYSKDGKTLIQYAIGKTDTSFIIPDSVTNIGSNAFRDCTSLTSVTIGDSVTSIASFAFYGCSSLTSITIPDSVTSIGSGAFWSCSSLNAVYITDIAKWCAIDFGSYDANPLEYAHNLYLNGELVTDLVIPDSVTSIGSYAFRSCSSLTSVTIGDSVTSIGECAFYNCTSLTNVTIPDSVTSIGEGAFSDCSSLPSITIPDSVTSIGSYAFRYCSKLTSITVDENNPSYKSIDGNLYSKDGKTLIQYAIGKTDTSFIIPDSVLSLGDAAFRNCTSLTSVTIGDSVTSIGEGAFYNCTSLTSITLPFIGATKDGTSNTHFGYIFGASSASYHREYVPTSLKTVVITGVTSIGSSAFSSCVSLTSVTIPDSVKSIGSSAFWGCSSLQSITIPDSVTSIDAYAFYNCTRLTSVTIGDSVTSIGERAFYNCTRLTSVTIPDSVTSIGGRAFEYCTSLTSVTIPESVTSIGGRAFEYCTSLNAVYISDIAKWCAIDFSNYAYASNPLYYAHNLYLNGELVTALVIPDSVTSIGSYAFYNCTSLTSVTIPDSVTSIGSSAFSNCSSLQSITIPDSVTSIGSYAFCDCTSLTSVTIGDSVTSIGSGAFDGCNNIIRKESGVSYVDKWVIDCDTSVTTVTLRADTIGIASYAFYYYTSLTSVTIPDSVTNIGSLAFSGCTSLTNITVDENNPSYKSIDGNLYSKDGKTLIQYAIGKTDTSFIIPDSVTSIGEGAFYNCTSLTSIIIPESVTSIGLHAFSNCTSLTIYAEAESEPEGWDTDWNYSNRPVVWGYKGSEE